MIVKYDGFPLDGRYVITLAPNGRKHVAHVNGPFIQLAGQRAPVYMADMLGEDDQWEELNEYNSKKLGDIA